MNRTKIAYLTHTWNPLAMRCTPISAGCKNCWHLKMADRLAKNPKIPAGQRKAYSGGWLPMPVQSRLEEPLRLRNPARIGVQFMGDLFHKGVALSSITQIFDVMSDARCEEHTFAVLTKRPERYNKWINWACEYWPGDTPFGVTMEVGGRIPNVWFGVSVENQETADERIPELLRMPAAVRFVSVEPMLESVDFREWTWDGMDRDDHPLYKRYEYPTGAIDWIICGSESGPNARPMDEDWVRDLRDQCIDTNVPFFYKQQIVDGKKVLMPELDGQVWDQYPKETR